MTRTVNILAEFDLGHGLTLVHQEVNGTYSTGALYSYQKYDLETELEGIELLAALAAVLKNLPEDGAIDFSQDGLEDFLQEWAAETAEEEELPFTYERADGSTQTYTPASLWEASGGCEWEESAQYGSDYGWNI